MLQMQVNAFDISGFPIHVYNTTAGWLFKRNLVIIEASPKPLVSIASTFKHLVFLTALQQFQMILAHTLYFYTFYLFLTLHVREAKKDPLKWVKDKQSSLPQNFRFVAEQL